MLLDSNKSIPIDQVGEVLSDENFDRDIKNMSGVKVTKILYFEQILIPQYLGKRFTNKGHTKTSSKIKIIDENNIPRVVSLNNTCLQQN